MGVFQRIDERLSDRDYERLAFYVGALKPEEHRMNEWERNFFNSIVLGFERWGRRWRMTKPRWDKLEEIYERLTEPRRER